MTATTAQAFWVEEPGRGALRTETLAPPDTDQVRVRALHSGISRGTEALVFNGQVPPSEYQRMRAPFQQGDFPGPVKYGYASVGLVEAGPKSLLGQTVFCLHPHQSHYVVPATAVLPLPKAVPAARAVLAANMETAVNGLWDAGPRIGDRISIIGGGVVGLLLGWLSARLPGTEVELIDINPERAELATHLGCRFATPDQARTKRDLVFHVSGAPAGLTTALGLAGQEARVIEMSWYGRQAVSVPLGEAFHARRLQLISSQVGQVAPRQRPRWTHSERLALALTLLVAPELDALINEHSAFEDLPATLQRLSRHPGSALCHRIDY
ncbi:zinc-binding alcohol dehydrogenase [Natronospirillum operosum]|uniref:Zinc-binding alcohol dehydrogenase n=1 Tax=Natronospirillum operosum TaxID=2759953 RepID=A0A4Z0W9U7_9GAMM|nr:zinc-binding alcohol dehydrogenase [Natronospirillum operosum]TGG92103.1 zinc-binding alcohol dehydrogenase [Natronospirillum operosum]